MTGYMKRLSIIIIPALLSSCISAVDTLDPTWSPEIFFKNAQEASGDSRYKDALFYYDVFLIRYPESIPRKIAARYEQAFIHYKMGKIKVAEAQFNAILKEYDENPFAALFPLRFKQLCIIGLKNIERNRALNNKLFWRMNEKRWAEEHNEELTDNSTVP